MASWDWLEGMNDVFWENQWVVTEGTWVPLSAFLLCHSPLVLYAPPYPHTFRVEACSHLQLRRKNRWLWSKYTQTHFALVFNETQQAPTHTHTHFPATLKLQLASIMFSHQYWIEQIIMWWLYNSSVCFSEVNWGKQSGAGCLHPLSIPVLQIYSLLGQNVPPRGPPVRLPWRILSSVTKLSPKVSTFCWTLLSHFPHCTIHNVILPLQVWSAWDYVCGISPHLTEMEWVVRTVCSRAFTQRWSCVSVQH